MPKFGKVAFLPMLISAVLAATAGAQGSDAKECDVDENKGNLGMAVFALSAAMQAGIPQAEQTKQLQTGIGRMFPDDPRKNEADNAANPVGRAFVLGKIYMTYLGQPDMPVVTTRGALGFKSNPTGVADLSIGIDSAFGIVEAKNPDCAQLMGQWRQQQGWVKLVGAAIDLANRNQVDSADIVAQQAVRISPNAPYSHLVLGTVAASRNRNMDAIKQYKAALVEAQKDTVFDDVRRTILYTLGNFALDAGQADTVKANQAEYLAESKAAWQALKADPGTKYGDAARQGLTAVLRATGDTAAIHNACSEQVANPAGFPFLSLVQCGVTLAEINDDAKATTLFEAAYAQNPYHRDGLYNLGRMQLKQGQFDKAIATTDRLVSVDPSNPDNYKLYVLSYVGIRKHINDLQDSVGRATDKLGRTAPEQVKRKALIDSTVKLDAMAKDAANHAVNYNNKADSMPVRVIFTEFTPTAEKATISGQIENRTDSEKSYVLELEFIDKEGKTITTAKATVDKVPGKNAGTFAASAPGQNIIAFRYKPIGG